MYLDPELQADPDFQTPSDQALRVLPPDASFTVLWREDGKDGMEDLNDAIALAVSKAIELGQQVVVTVSANDDGGRRSEEWDGLAIFVAGPNRHRVQRAKHRR